MAKEDKKNPQIRALHSSLKDDEELWNLDDEAWEDMATKDDEPTDSADKPPSSIPEKKKKETPASKLSLEDLEEEDDDSSEDEDYDESFFDEDEDEDEEEISEDEIEDLDSFNDNDNDDDDLEEEPESEPESKILKEELKEKKVNPRRKLRSLKKDNSFNSLLPVQRSIAEEIDDLEAGDDFDDPPTEETKEIEPFVEEETKEEAETDDSTTEKKPLAKGEWEVDLEESDLSDENEPEKEPTQEEQLPTDKEQSSSTTIDDILDEMDHEVKENSIPTGVNGIEKFLILICLLALIGLGVFAVYYLNRDLEENTAQKVERFNTRLPAKGKTITITHLDTYWAPPLESANVSAKTKLVPLCFIKAEIKGKGCLRLFFRDSDGKTIGDVLNLPYSNGKFEASGKDLVKITGTSGLKDEVDFSLLSGGQENPWNATIYEGPNDRARTNEFKELSFVIIDSSIAEN